MKAPCKKKTPKHLYEDEEYTSCSFCKEKCSDAITCFNCGKKDHVFYSRRYDLFGCSYCYGEFDRSMQR